jgi:hypothetical protein
MGDRKPYIYKTADFGKTWQKIVTGIPDTDFLRVVREDIKRRGLLYAGTEHGIYLSFNDGASWQSLKLDLPTTPVHGIVSEERDLVIGTHGRGFYVLDNVGVLRQATPELTNNTLFLFEPLNPMRGRDRNVTFDYFLNKDASEVKIEFLDSTGTVLRTFTGGGKPVTPPAGGDGDFGGFGGPARVTTQKGINRFSWDMRYEGATVFPGMIMWAAQPQRGPAAPTGRYPVRVSANGETKSRDFTVTIDPRLVADGISEADLLAQFKLSLRVRDKVSEANQAVIDIRSLREQINQRLQKVSGRRKDEIQKLADAVLIPLTMVEEEAYQVRNRSGQDPLNYPIKLNNKIAALSGVIESADNKPTDQSVEVFNELSAQLDAQLAKMKETLAKQLPALNAALKREKMDAVDPKAKPAPAAAPAKPQQ